MAIAAGGIRAGGAFVEITARTAALQAGLAKAQAKIASFAGTVKQAGMGMMKLGALGAAPLIGAAKVFADFELQMATVKAVIQPTTDEFAALNQEALRIGRDTVFSSSDAAKAMVYFARAGFSVKEMLDATGPTVNLAAANMMTMEQATTAVIPVLRGMGMQAGELTRVIDVLNAAANASFTDVTLLSAGFAYVAADARAAGLSIEQTAAFLAVLSDAGVRGEKAGTGLRAVLADFKQVTPAAAAELKRLGVVLHDADANWREPGAILGDLLEKVRNMGSFARDQSLAKIFDVRSGSAATIMMQSLEKYYEYQKRIGGQAGVTDRMSATMLDTLSGSWKMLTSSVEGFVLEVGRGLAPLLREWSVTMVLISNQLARWASVNSEIIRDLARMAVTTVTVGGAITAMGGAVQVASFAFGALAGTMTIALIPLKLGLAGILAMTTAAGLLKAALLAAGVGILGFTTGGNRLVVNLGRAFKAVGQGIQASFGRIGEDARSAVQGVTDALISGDLKAAFEIISLGAKAAWNDFLASLWNTTPDFLAGIGGAFVTVMSDAYAAIEKGWLATTKWFGDQWDQTWAKISSAWDDQAWSKALASMRERADRVAVQRKDIEDRQEGRAKQIADDVAREIKRRELEAAKAGNTERQKIETIKGRLAESRELAETLADMNAWFDQLEKGKEAARRAQELGKGGLIPGKDDAVVTFANDLLGQMGSSTVTQTIAANTGRAAEAAEKLVRNLGDGQPRFA